MRGRGRTSIRQVVSGAVAGRDLTVIGQYTTLEVSRREFRVVPFTQATRRLPQVEEARAQPSRLLDAQREVIGFTGRDRELAVLHAWRKLGDNPQASAFLIDGEGGSGKTRLARQFAMLSAQDGWAAWEASYEQAASLTPLPESLTGRRQRGTLFLIDYAERWPAAQLFALARHLVTASGEQPIRLLLLSRAAGDWWEVLSHRLNREGIATQARHMQPLSAGPRGAKRLFTQARDRFAEVLQVPGADQIDVPDLSHDDFGLVLAVHMAALVAVYERLRQPGSRLQASAGSESDSGASQPEDPARLSAYLLRRERVAWHRLPPTESQRPRSSGTALGRIVYAAVLAGPLPRLDAEDVLARARLAGTSESAAALLDDHRTLYPPRQPGADLEPMYPDRLAEDFLALATPPVDGDGVHTGNLADPWAADMPTALLAPAGLNTPARQQAPADQQAAAPAWARTGMTVLIQTAVRWEHVRTGYLYPLLRAHPELATATGSAALATLVELDDLDAEVVDAVEPLLPEGQDYELDLVMAALTRRLAQRRLAAVTDAADQARLHVRFGTRYSAAGFHEQALLEYQEATDTYRAVAEGDPGGYRASLADALNRLAIEHAFLEHPAELALALSEEAVGLLRVADPDAEGYLDRLVPVLLSLGDRLALARLRRQDEAFAIREEAVSLARQLADDTRAISTTSTTTTSVRDRELSLWNLAAALTSLSRSLRDADRAQDAVTAAQEGVERARQLAAANRNRYLALLAWTLGELAEALRGDGQNAAWLAAVSESANLYRLLATANPNVYLDPLARVLANYGIALNRNGQPTQALDATEEALAIQRDLARASPALQGLMYAAALCDYSDWLAAIGQNAQAITAAREALSVVESLPGMAARDIVMPTTTLAKRLAASEGLSLARSAVALHHEVVASGETEFIPDLADAYCTLSGVLKTLGQPTEAQAAAEEAVSLMRPLTADENPPHLQTLAWALRQLAMAFSADPERKNDAVPPMQESLDIYRTALSPQNGRDQFSLAQRQQELIGMLTTTGQDAEALPLTAGVAETARACMAATPALGQHYLLCWALHDFAWTRWTTKQQLPEAADALDELARRLRSHPGDGDTLALPDLVNTLRVRAWILTHLGRTEEADAVLRVAASEKIDGQAFTEALTPGRPAARRWFTLINVADFSDPRGVEALAVAAVTAEDGSWERALAVFLLKRRRWFEKHGPRWLAGRPAEGNGPDAASLLADVTAFDASDPGKNSRTRLNSAMRLVKLGDPRGVQYLLAQAQDRGLRRRFRQEAARALAKAGDPRGEFLLADIQAEQANDPGGSDPAWPLALAGDITPTLRGVTPAAMNAIRQHQSARATPETETVGTTARLGTQRRAAHALLTHCTAVLALLVPVGIAVLLGDAIAQAPGTHPGPGNWLALCVSALLTWLLLEPLTGVCRFAARVFKLSPDARSTSTGCYVLLMPVLIVVGYLLAGSPTLVFLRPAGEFIWHTLIWR
jgi:hypothetical protein